MSRVCFSSVTLLLSISVSMVILVVECLGQQIPGPHYPIATGASGAEPVYTGTTPSFQSYRFDNEGKEYVYVPVFTAVYTDAGESTHKDVRQNFDKSISIQGNGEFRCAFGHPYRQLALQDKYKWEQFINNFKPPDAQIPAMPLIRSFLVESHVVKDIMLQSTTQEFYKIAGVQDINMDGPATNQFGIHEKSKSSLEAFALPGSLITYVEDINKLSPKGEENTYTETLKSWGKVRDVADLKEQFNVPTEHSSSPETSMFVTAKKKKNNKLDISVAKSDEVGDKLTKQNKKEWNTYLSVLKQMDAIPKPTDPGKVQMLDLSPKPINEYPSDKMADTDTLIKEQARNRQRHERVQQLSSSFELLTEATTDKRITWENFVTKTETELTKNNKLKTLTNTFIQLSVDFMSNTMNFKNIKKIEEVIKTEFDQIKWQYCSNLDKLQENLKRVSNFLEEKKILTDFPRGERFSKSGLYEYYKNSLVSYIQSNECKLDKDIKSNLLQHVNADNPTKRELVYSNDANTDSKNYVGDKKHNQHIFFPGDTLSIEIVGQEIDALQIKSYTSDVFDATLSISQPKKVSFTFPDTNLDDTTESTWKKYAVEVGDYLKDSMRVQSIDFTFKDSKLLTYNMISHIIEGNVKEMPVRLVDGHLVVDDRIASADVSRSVTETYNKIIKDETGLTKHIVSQNSDILFVPMDNGLFLSNTQSSDISNSMKVADYKNKKFEKPIKNEILVELIPPDVTETVSDLTKNNKRSPAGEASDMLAAGYRQKNKNANVISVSATTENGNWEINLEKSAGIENYDDVRITLVGISHTSSIDGVWTIGGQKSENINGLLKHIKQNFNIKGTNLRKVSVVVCNPDPSSANLENNVEAAIKLAEDVARENKVSVSTRVGYVKVDEEGHTWYSATNDEDYQKRQHGDIYIAVWDDKKQASLIKKTSVEADNILLDVDNKLSNHLGVKQNIAKEHESNIIKGGFDISKELSPRVKKSQNKKKVQKILKKLGDNAMSAYGMLQTAAELLEQDECEDNEDTSKEACEARKTITKISLAQQAIETVHEVGSAGYKKFKKKTTKPKTPTVKTFKVSKAGTSTAKSFKSSGKSLLRNSMKGLAVLGVGLDMASLGLDIYDLTKAQTPTEKGIGGTNVALSSLSLIAGAAAIVAEIAEAASVAAVAGPAALVVGIVSFAFSIAVSIWQTVQYEKEHDPLVNEAAKYFYSTNVLYGGSWYYCENATLYMKAGISFKTVNLNDKYIEIDSEYMCETMKKNYKENVRIYPLLFGSTICDDYSEIESNCYCQTLGCPGMINVRLGMNIDGRKTMQCEEINTIVINSAPIALRGYSYAYFDKFDPVTGLIPRDPESRFQDRGHQIARQIGSKNSNFDYDYHFCWDKYAIINNINTNKYIPSVTNIELGPDQIRLIVPEFEDPSFVTLSITGIQGFVYTVSLSNSCRVVINSYLNSSISTDDNQTLWRIVVDAELVDFSCYSNNGHLFCSYESSHIEINNTQENQVIIFDMNNIISIPVSQDNVTMMYIAEVQASNFSSDQDFLEVMSRYFLSNNTDLSMMLIPVKNLLIRRCGHENIAVSYLSKENSLPKLHYTSEFQYQCSDVFNTDAKIQLLENDTIYYSSSQHSLVWRSDFLNNSLLSFAKLPCHSETGSDVSIYVLRDQIYVNQKIGIPDKFGNYTLVEAEYRLTFTQLFLLHITSDLELTWSNLERYCFQSRNQIFSDKEQLLLKTMEILAGENDFTFVNTSNEVYWVKKQYGNVHKRIIPNLGVRCESIDISFSDDLSGHITSYEQRVENGSSTFNDELFYFLCKNGNHTQMYEQSGNNQAKAINSLLYQNIYIKRNEILLQNETDTFAFDDNFPSKMCLFEYELNLPYTAEESFEHLMDEVSDTYECVESKTKLKFIQLVGWFDFEEYVTVIVHETIASYDLKPMGTTRDLTKYWIWDTYNQTLYLQTIAEPSSLMSLLVGNISEHDYHTMVPIPEKVFVDAQEVEYESGRIYVYSSDGATYYVDEVGNSDTLAVTDFWFSRHPDAIDELRQNTEREAVIYRPSKHKKELNTNSTLRYRRSIEQTDALVPSILFHIAFDKVFNVDLSKSVYVGSNRDNMSVYTFNYHNKEFLELDEDGNVLLEEKYSIIHRIDQTLIVESCNATENRVPPIIDGVKTIVLSSSELGFEFDITEDIWSKVDEILIQADSDKLTINLHMLPCDYDLESIDGRFILLDYAHRKKLVIPNAEERSKAGLVVLYVCDVQIVLHYTKTVHIQLVIAFVTLLSFTTAVAMVYAWRKHTRVSPTKPTGFIPTERELQEITQGVVQPEHVRVAENRAAVLGELKGDMKHEVIGHKILTRHK